MSIEFKNPERVRYNGGKSSYGWDPTDPSELVPDRIYYVDALDQYPWHTEVRLVGVEGVFNSTWFDEVEEDE